MSALSSYIEVLQTPQEAQLTRKITGNEPKSNY